MNGYVVLSLSLISCLVLVFLILALWGLFRQLMLSKDLQITNLSQLLNDERQQKLELLNRLMSDDLKTFKTLNSQNSSVAQFSEYVPQSDEAEVQRLHHYYNEHGIAATGLGEGNYDDTELASLQDVLNTAP